MQHVNAEQIISALKWRYAVKKFDASKKISAKEWGTIEEAFQLTASSYGLQPWKFLVVQSPDIRKKLTPVSWGQTQIEDCSHLVVLTALRQVTEQYIQKFVSKMAQDRSIDPSTLDGYKKMMVGDLVNGPRAKVIQTWAQKQTYIAMGNVLMTAALMGIDTTPMEGIEPEKYDEILGLKSSPYMTTTVIAFGYRHAEDKLQFAKKVRFEKADILQNI